MARLVDIRPDERRRTLGAFSSLLGLMAAYTLIETARDALFLAKVPVGHLPWVYLAVAAVGLALARAQKSGRGGARAPRLPASMIAAAAVTLVFWAGSGVRGTWFLYALYLWSGVLATWVVGQLWIVLGASYTLAQAKRLYGLIGAGGVLGAVLGAAGARALTARLGAEHLLLGGALLLVATGAGPARLLDPTTAAAPRRAVAHETPAASLAGILAGDPYVRRVLALVLLATMTVTGVDFLFKSEVAASVPKERLGAYLATTYLVLNSAALVAQVFLVRVAVRVLGVQRALWIMPGLMLAGAGYVAAGGGLSAALLLRGADGTLRHSLHKTATELLFVPLPDATRARAKPLVDLVGQRGGQALASLAILGLFALGLRERALGVGVGVLAAAWLAVAVTLRKPYLDVFRKTLREGRIDDAGGLPVLDLSALETLMGALNSQKDPEVLGALDLLSAQERHRLIPALILFHPSKPIVLRALSLFTAHGRTDFVPVADRLLSHADPEVRTAALRARAAVAPDERFLRALLDDAADEVRATALVTLVARGWMTGEEADRALEARIHGPLPVRLALARAIELDPAPRFEATLLALVEDPDPDLRAAVAAAMGRMETPAFVPILVSLLEHRRTAAAAREALSCMGPAAQAALDRALGEGTLRTEILWAVPRALAELGPELATPVLLRHLGDARTDGMVKFRILRALKGLRADDPDLALDAGVLLAVVDETVRAMFRDLALRLGLEAAATPPRRTPAFALLVTLLRDKESDALARLSVALGLLHPREDFARIHRGLQSPDPKTRASSRELLEHVLDPRHRGPVLSLVDDAPDAERLERGGAFVEEPPRDYDGLLAALIERGGELGSLSAYHAAEIGLAELAARARPPADDGALGAKLWSALPLASKALHAT